MSGDGLTLPATGGGISGETVAFAAGLTDRSGKAPVIEAALARATGRPRPLPVRAVLTALACLALDDRPLFLTEATRLLFCQLSPASGPDGFIWPRHDGLKWRRLALIRGRGDGLKWPRFLPGQKS